IPSGNIDICNGDSVILSSDSVNGNQWYVGGSTIVGATSQQLVVNSGGNYQLELTTNGCTDLSSTVVVTLHPIPTSMIDSTGPLTYCSNEETYLISDT
ncbi:MAG: hypothetical protein IH946_09465, partial [Bacteroidetes bacterium]|nr:hypothetical protein [Bacteroidota bacterium]